MGQGTFASGQTSRENEILSRVREGMAVYDVNRNHIGVVETLYFGEGTREQLERGEGPATPTGPYQPENNLVYDIARVFDSDNVPPSIRARLRQAGFIRLDADGFFAADRYIMSDQIAQVDDHVHLNVTRDSLIKR